MNLDGFEPEHCGAFKAFSPAVADRFFARVDALGKLLGVSVEGIDQLPKGRGLLVANHAFGFDVVFPMAAIWRATRRPVWVLGEHLWWKVPFLRRFVAALGTVDGTPANLDALLSGDQLVLVLPGGLREAVKPRELRYQLLWGHRYGFVRAAIRHGAPVIPLASVGSDELFDFVGNPYHRGARWLRRRDFPVPLPARILPIPHRVRVQFVLGEAIVPRVAPSEHEDFASVRSFRREVEGALHELIENELARRLGIDLS